MAKSTESVLDDQELPDREEQQEQDEKEQSTDVRSAIRAAFDEHRDDNTEKTSEDDSGQRQQKQRSSRKNKEDESADGSDSNKDLQKSNKRSAGPSDGEENKDQPEDKGGVKKEDIKIDPPPFYKNKGKTTWEKLSPEDKQTIVAREKEVSDGFAQVSQRIKNVEDIERVIAPRLQTIQRYGVPPAQMVDRLFQWMESLQNPQTAAKSFKDLAEGLGVNLNQLVGQPNAKAEETENTGSPPTWFSEFTNTVDQRLSRVDQIEQQIVSQREVAAKNAVLTWAKDKPYYQQVAPLMGQLLQSGIVGLKEDGTVDLDGAYEKAIKLDPNVAALIQQEAATKASKEAEEKSAKEAKEKAERLTRAKRAGVGLKPAAPSGPLASANSKGLNGSGKKDTSVRGSIRAAMEEVRDQ